MLCPIVNQALLFLSLGMSLDSAVSQASTVAQDSFASSHALNNLVLSFMLAIFIARLAGAFCDRPVVVAGTRARLKRAHVAFISFGVSCDDAWPSPILIVRIAGVHEGADGSADECANETISGEGGAALIGVTEIADGTAGGTAGVASGAAGVADGFALAVRFLLSGGP